MNSLPDSVLDLIASGRKIEAIKEVRALTGMGLRDAKETVEAIERGESISIQIQPRSSQVHGSGDSEAPDELAARVLALVQGGQSIQAVKEVRDATGVDLRDAKQLVDQIAQTVQPTPDSTHLQQVKARQSARLVVLAALIVALMGFLVVWLMAA